MPVKCKKCDGFGIGWNGRECKNCDGEGVIYQVSFSKFNRKGVQVKPVDKNRLTKKANVIYNVIN